MAATDSPGENARVAVLGTGIMGSAIARNLVSAGLRTTVRDRSPTATAPLSDAGALVTASPTEAVLLAGHPSGRVGEAPQHGHCGRPRLRPAFVPEARPP